MIDNKVLSVIALLRRVQDYNNLVTNDGFAPATIVDLKSNAKDICDLAKSEIDAIKDLIDGWS